MIFPLVLLLNNAHAFSLGFPWFNKSKPSSSPNAPAAPVTPATPGSPGSSPNAVNPATENFSDNIDAVTLGKKLDLKGWEPKKEITKKLSGEILDERRIDQPKFKEGIEKLEADAKRGKI